MRAARLLHMLLLLQNRGRLTSAALAAELEVSARTILRDVDALTEAGLPVIVYQGNQGGIELGFAYRTRLTGLDRDEAAAMGLILSAVPVWVADLGFGQAGARAIAKLAEAFPDQTRAQIAAARAQFAHDPGLPPPPDPRIASLAAAVRGTQVVWLDVAGVRRQVHPVGLDLGPGGWALRDGLTGDRVPIDLWGAINISAATFGPADRAADGPAR